MLIGMNATAQRRLRSTPDQLDPREVADLRAQGRPDPEAVAALRQLLASESPYRRAAAAILLAELADDPLPLKAMVEDGDATAGLLSYTDRVATAEARAVLQEAVRRELRQPDLRRAEQAVSAAVTLGAVGDGHEVTRIVRGLAGSTDPKDLRAAYSAGWDAVPAVPDPAPLLQVALAALRPRRRLFRAPDPVAELGDLLRFAARLATRVEEADAEALGRSALEAGAQPGRDSSRAYSTLELLSLSSWGRAELSRRGLPPLEREDPPSPRAVQLARRVGEHGILDPGALDLTRDIYLSDETVELVRAMLTEARLCLTIPAKDTGPVDYADYLLLAAELSSGHFAVNGDVRVEQEEGAQVLHWTARGEPRSVRVRDAGKWVDLEALTDVLSTRPDHAGRSLGVIEWDDGQDGLDVGYLDWPRWERFWAEVDLQH